jgi:hypothetical protein
MQVALEGLNKLAPKVPVFFPGPVVDLIAKTYAKDTFPKPELQSATDMLHFTDYINLDNIVAMLSNSPTRFLPILWGSKWVKAIIRTYQKDFGTNAQCTRVSQKGVTYVHPFVFTKIVEHYAIKLPVTRDKRKKIPRMLNDDQAKDILKRMLIYLPNTVGFQRTVENYISCLAPVWYDVHQVGETHKCAQCNNFCGPDSLLVDDWCSVFPSERRSRVCSLLCLYNFIMTTAEVNITFATGTKRKSEIPDLMFDDWTSVMSWLVTQKDLNTSGSLLNICLCIWNNLENYQRLTEDQFTHLVAIIGWATSFDGMIQTDFFNICHRLCDHDTWPLLRYRIATLCKVLIHNPAFLHAHRTLQVDNNQF